MSDVTRSATPKSVKEAILDLLKNGVIEAARKPNVYRLLLSSRPQLDVMLEPLDLMVRIDEVRGLIFLAVPHPQGPENAEEADEWLHPLVRRVRLTLEQSLVVAILRRLFIGHELEIGAGAEVTAALEDVLPDLRAFLGDPGSERQEEKRLRALLEQLRAHGLVSELDENDRFSIRPLIVHVANPENLQLLIDTLNKTQTQAENATEGATE